MALDDRGRWILARERSGLIRLTIPDDDSEIQVEVVNDTLRECRGLLYAYDSLYVCATNDQGFYRLRDTTGDDQFDDVTLLKTLRYEYRFGHGPNQVVLGPDGMIYIVNGNDVWLPEAASPASPYRDPRDDHLLPNPRDVVEADIAAGLRVGYILRTDPEGKTWDVFAGGFRNQFDIAFNAAGEMFTFDADMEWDLGQPWYRPTRVNHVVSAAEFGWRWGTGKWPAYYPDSLPGTLDVGLGSPTGLAFGTGSRFPPRYQEALFMGEWQHGRILLVDLTPDGSTYTGSFESFVEGGPLNVCDLVFGSDGALYFVTGGRQSQSGLYRVTYVGPPAAPRVWTEAEQAVRHEAARARVMRRKLETYHSLIDPAAVDLAWLYLGSPDLWLRHAARLALERQDVTAWRQRALDEKDPATLLTALLALARQGKPEDQEPIVERLGRLPLSRFSRDRLLLTLRVYALSFVRQGAPGDGVRAAALQALDPLYPHSSSWVNQELCELLLYLTAPRAVDRTIALLEEVATQEEQIHYAMALSRVRDGWTREARVAIFRWLHRARKFRGGRPLPTHLKLIENDLREALSDADRIALAPVLAALDAPGEEGVSESAAGLAPRPLVKEWTVEDFLPDLAKAGEGRSHAGGKQALRVAACLQCHRFGEEGRATGPDLTHVGRRFDTRAILDSILTPSAVVDEKYRPTTYVMRDGTVVTGLPVITDTGKIHVETDSLAGEVTIVERGQIAESFPSKLSPMPAGLLDTLTREEVLDLVAYLRSDVVP
jgi:putative heme-binding domain-containing protein